MAAIDKPKRKILGGADRRIYSKVMNQGGCKCGRHNFHGMKRLEELTDADKAELLAELFPNELQALIPYLKIRVSDLKDNRRKYRAKWSNTVVKFDTYYQQAMRVQAQIVEYGNRLYESPKTFGKQLTDQGMEIFSSTCIVDFAKLMPPHEKFRLLVEILYLR